MRKILITAIFVSLALAVACGKKEAAKTENVPLAEPLNVPTAKVSTGSMEDFYEATGTIKAKTTTNISANMMGRILSIPVAEGSYVQRGQMLVEIDNRESKTQQQKAEAGVLEAQAALIEIDKAVISANAAVKSAEANKVFAEQTLVRIKELFDRKSASAQEYDEALSRVRIANAEIERARTAAPAILAKKKQILAKIEQAKADIAGTKVFQSYSKIASPVSGLVVKKFAEQGAIASPGQPLLSIEDSSNYRLEAAVEESRSKLIQIGNRVMVKIDALGDGELFGVVAEVNPSADAASRSYTVKIDIPASPMLKTGLYGLARFPVSGKTVISVPQTAVTERGGLSGVYVVNQDGTISFRIVTTGKSADGNVEILSGLSEGDEYVSADIHRVTDGARIR